MEQLLELTNASTTELSAMRRLYRSAFPRNERKPFALLTAQAKRGCTDLLAIRGDGQFLGMMISVHYRDMALLDYFAVLPEARGNGIGAKALQLYKKRYAGKRIFLEIERPMQGAANNMLRMKRKAFYLNNGMRDIALRLCVFHAELELLCAGAPVTFEEYCALLKATLGPFFFAIIRPRRVDTDR